jgi:peptidoglycan/LPS O-acetylase OafA/YrhL
MTKTYAVPPAPPHNEGKTVAAWSTTVATVLGAIIAGVGLTQTSVPMVAVGAAVVVLGFIIAIVLRVAGLGQKRRGSSSR